MCYNGYIIFVRKRGQNMMKINDLSWVNTENVRGGNGNVAFSPEKLICDIDGKVLAKLQIMIVKKGSYIGRHDHPDGISEIYLIIKGKPALINGKRCKFAICKPNEFHDLRNDTDGDIIVLSIKF